MPKINKLPFVKPDENLSKVVGNEAIQTSELIKRMFAYIKRNNLIVKKS
jgi:chromatin remodeling complex protein RSC6